MHILSVTTASKAKQASIETLFRPGGTATNKVKYSAGKYGSSLVGRELEVPDHVVALWTAKRTDKDGPYFTLYAYTR